MKAVASSEGQQSDLQNGEEFVKLEQLLKDKIAEVLMHFQLASSSSWLHVHLMLETLRVAHDAIQAV
jgi:hypothetical protein